MKKTIIINFIFILFFGNITQNISQDLHTWDMKLTNNTSYDIQLSFFPISFVMNGIHEGSNYMGEYDLFANGHAESNNQEHGYYYINGAGFYNYNSTFQNRTLAPQENVFFNWDYSADRGDHIGFGYGIYKMILKTTDDEPRWLDSIVFDLDAGNGPGDIHIDVDYDNAAFVTMLSFDDVNWITIDESNYYIKTWEHPVRERDFGKFNYGSATYLYNNTNLFPLDARRDCNRNFNSPPWNGFPWFNEDLKDQNQDGSNADSRNGNLTLNLNVFKNIQTPIHNDMINFPTTINILKIENNPCSLIVYPAVTFTLKYDDWHTQNNNRYSELNNYGYLFLDAGSVIKVETYNKLKLLSHSSFVMFSSELYIDWGGFLYLQCPNIQFYGNSKIKNYGSIIQLACPDNPLTFEDSANITLFNGASWEVPNNSSITFNGNGSILKLDSNSKIIFGQNSHISFQNGARLIANNATFTSSNQSTTWDGIYLSGSSHDTIIGCTIQNAVNGISITDKNDPLGLSPPSTEISGCTFIDSSSSQLTTGITVSNSNNVLIKNNTFISTSAIEGFLSAVLVEYCPAGNLDILDNTISNVNNGLTVVQSSPYIARNTINGQQNDGIGIYLDNSNGTLKYNNVSNFSKSLVASYSSPYLYRNTFSGPSDRNIDLYQNSVPLMNPVNSGSTLRWLGGNNFISGEPTSCGIYMNDNSYPAIDSGFNNFTLNGSNYVVCGNLQSQVLDFTYNYWQDRPPVDYKFVVSNGTVIDTPDYDGSTIAKPDGFELNNIGFGLYDSTYYKDLGGNSPVENLYTQAYINEMTGHYLTAISQYKQVVSNYRNSELVPAAISRIINCLEKKISTASDYSQLQTYMHQVFINNNIPHIIRELAEDLVIKSLVRQNQFQRSISDYDSM